MKKLKNLIPQKIKNTYHLGQAIAANFLYGFPSGKIKVIGVTGTNGKTTTVQMITEILEEAGHKVAMASTINFKVAEKIWVNKTKFTTLSSFGIQKFINQAVSAGCEYLVLETSSHSLDQNRVWGVDYKTAVITNVTREHLDYHKDMEHYRIAKLKLFQKIKTAVVNLDMENARDYLDCGGQKIKYGFSAKKETKMEDRDYINYDCGEIQIIKADNIALGINYSNFQVKGIDFSLKIPGLFNVENSLAAISVGISEQIDLEIIKKALEKITGIPGRMEHVSNDRNLDIIVDYAVTPDSLEKMYNLVSRIKKSGSRVIAVFGSCGERDRGKRPIMGKIVDAAADFIILTNEDPYGEDPSQIIKEVAAGIKNKKENDPASTRGGDHSSTRGGYFWKIPDRREAIKKALGLAKAGDVIVVSGKGAEVTMAIGDEIISWNDKIVIQETLQEIKSKKHQ